MVRTPEEQTFYAKRFALWLAIGSMIMMFAGLTSAYIVKKGDAETWTVFAMPGVFFASTLAILLSSVSMHLALRSFKRERLAAYRDWMGLTLLLGTAFIVLQMLGWNTLTAQGYHLAEEVSSDFFYVISGAHAIHVAGGLIILLSSWLLIRRKLKDPVYDLTMPVSPGRKFRVELVATYWHFVDALWIYLFLFLLYNHS